MPLEYRHRAQCTPGLSGVNPPPGGTRAGERRRPMNALDPCSVAADRRRSSCRIARVLRELDARRRPPRRASARSRVAQAAARSVGVGSSSSAPERSDSSRLRRRRRRAQLELGEDRARLGRPRRLAAAPLLGEPAAQLVVALVRVEDPAHDELRRDRPVPAVLLEPERDVVAADAAEAVELRRRCRTRSPSRRRGRAGGRGSAGACRRRPSTSSLSSQPSTSSVTPGLPRPNGAEARELLAERRARAPGRRRSRRRRSAGGGRRRRAPRRRARANAAANASTARARIVRPAAARWPPKRSRCSEHAASAACRSNAPGDAARALPAPVGAGDQDDRPAVALDEPRGDDPDHALVPVRAGDDVAAAGAARSAGHDSISSIAARRIRSSTACRSRFSASSSSASRVASPVVRRSAAARAPPRGGRGGRRR